MSTKVIFRTFRDHGDVIAIFPEIPATRDPDMFDSYQHIGQHGACQGLLTGVTRPSTAEEIAPLKAELEGLGYTLALRKRYTARHATA